MSRFDIGAVSQFQSRDGGITKGGIVRNGFTEINGKDSVWSWMRPALATSAEAEISGGLGLFKVGTTLYGMGNNGTAFSWQVTLGVHSLTLNAQAITANIYGYEGVYYNTGGLTPVAWFGRIPHWLYVNTSGSGYTELGLSGSSAAGKAAIGTLAVNGTFALGTAATFVVMTATQGTSAILVSNWTWNGFKPFSTSGIYAGFFT